MIDLGVDSDVDTPTFDGTVTNAVINNWEQGEDIIWFTGPAGVIWSYADNAGDRKYSTAAGQSFNVVGAAGLAHGNLVLDLTVNEVPTFIGATTALADGATGSLATDYSQDLNGLFDDVNIGDFDALTLSTSPPPTWSGKPCRVI